MVRGCLFLLKSLEKMNHLSQIGCIRMALGNTADQLKGAKGVESETAKFAYDLGVVFGNSLSNGLGVALLLCAVGVQEEYRLAVGQILLGKLQNGLMELGVVDTGSKANHVVAGQIGSLDLGYINYGHIVLGGNGIDQLFGIAMMLGIKDNCGFHSRYSLHFIGTNIILCIDNCHKYAENMYIVRLNILEVAHEERIDTGGISEKGSDHTGQ